MPLGSTSKIFLDIYNNSITTINAKQLDADSRFLNVVCTDYGKRIYLDPASMTAFVRYRNENGQDKIYDAEILDDGTVLITFNQEMLSVKGRCKADVLIINEQGLRVDDLEDATSLYRMGISILSTMTFYVYVQCTAIDHDNITSTSEYDALTKALGRLVVTETSMNELAINLNEAEIIRVNNEAERQASENERSINESLRNENELNRENAETTRKNAESARKAEETKRQNAENLRVEAEETRETNTANAISICETATNNANEAANRCDSVVDHSGVVLKTDMGVAGGVATLDENSKIPNGQLDLSSVESQLSALQTSISNIHKVHYGYSLPDNSLGNNGDIYMMIIE